MCQNRDASSNVISKEKIEVCLTLVLIVFGTKKDMVMRLLVDAFICFKDQKEISDN